MSIYELLCLTLVLQGTSNRVEADEEAPPFVNISTTDQSEYDEYSESNEDNEYNFTCNDGTNISSENVCDGLNDCPDNSDETEELCLHGINVTISTESGGLCIPANRVCDGTVQCRPASDEKGESCTKHTCPEIYIRCTSEGCTPAISGCDQPSADQKNCQSDGSDEYGEEDEDEEEDVCKLPPAKPGISYVVENCERCRPGQIVPEATKLHYSCQGDGDLEGSTSVFCQDNLWLPGLPLCPEGDGQIKCPRINSPGTLKRCEVIEGTQAGWTSCDKVLPVGTEVTMECREYYERERGSSRVTCRHDGTWSQTPLSCRQTCGVWTSDSSALIVKGWDAPVDEPVPWHAALFSHESGNWTFFCGGTLIAERVVLTAGHCVYKTSPDTIKVLLASNSSDFTTQSEGTQVMDIDRIEIQNSYQDHQGNYGSDLALLVLKKAAKINSYVMPACVDWSNNFDISQRNEEIGLIAGMGVTENETVSRTLRLVSAQIISDDTCREKQKRDFRKYLTYTSFCAGWANGTGVCNGDSGGGFLLRRPDTNVWDIQGIVSLSPRRLGKSLCDTNYYTIFTKVSVYVNWIQRIVRSIPLSEPELDDSVIPAGDRIKLD